MEISSLLGILVIVAGFLFVIGLIRPGFVVFWSDKKSRGSVLAVWGGALAVLAIAYWLTAHGVNMDNNRESNAKPAQNFWRG